MATAHENIANAFLHEPKDVNTALINTTYVANGAGSGSWSEPEPKDVRGEAAGKVYVTDGSNSGTMIDISEIVRMGFWDYNDTATTSSPIALTTGADIPLTNNELGANTNKTYKLSDVGDIWNASTDRFDFTDLNLGDTVDIRTDATVTTTTNNTVIELKFEGGIGGTPFQLDMGRVYFKSPGTYNLNNFYSVYMGDANFNDNPARLIMVSDAGSATCVVNGWYVRAFKRGLS